METKADIVQLANCELIDENRSQIKMGLLWQKQTSVFVFLRHFGCISCRAHAKQVWSLREQYEKSNAKLYFVGNGNPDFIMDFKNELGLGDAVIYTDPSLKSFYAAGFQRGFFRTFGPKSLINISRLKKQGYSNGEKDSGDFWQLGGVLVIKKDGKIAYHFISEAVGDFPAEEEVKKVPWLTAS